MHDRMIREAKNFFGRHWESRYIYDRLASMQSSSIVGERRIGKSSLLYCAKLPEIQARSGFSDTFAKYVFVYLDMQRHALSQQPEELLARILQLIAEEIPNKLEFDIGPKVDYIPFEEQIRTLGQLGLKIVVLFDEFDTVEHNKKLDFEFFNFLRSIAGQYNIAYVTASQRELSQLSRGDLVSSPFFNIFEGVRLGLMPEDEALELIRQPASQAGESFEKDTDVVLEWAGRHPYYIQLACRHLWDVIKTEGRDPGDHYLQKAKHRFLKSTKPHFEYIWDHLNSSERESLGQLVHFGSIEQSYTQSLIKKCVLVESEGDFDFACSTFRDFVAQKPLVIGPSPPPETTAPTKTAQPPPGEVVSTPSPPPETAPLAETAQSPPVTGEHLGKLLISIGLFLIIAVAALTSVAVLLRDWQLVLMVFAVLLLLLALVFPFIGLLTRTIREQTWFQAYLVVLERIPGLGAFIGKLNSLTSEKS